MKKVEKLLTVRIDAETDKELSSRSSEEHITKSDYVRILLCGCMKKKEEEGNKVSSLLISVKEGIEKRMFQEHVEQLKEVKKYISDQRMLLQSLQKELETIEKGLKTQKEQQDVLFNLLDEIKRQKASKSGFFSRLKNLFSFP